jgi:hypothetical protein
MRSQWRRRGSKKAVSEVELNVQGRGAINMALQVGLISEEMIVAVAMPSPDAVFETGLPMCPPERKERKLTCERPRIVSPVRLESKICRIPAIFSYSAGRAAGFLYCPDCVAERSGFEPSVQVLARTTV